MPTCNWAIRVECWKNSRAQGTPKVQSFVIIKKKKKKGVAKIYPFAKKGTNRSGISFFACSKNKNNDDDAENNSNVKKKKKKK